MFAGQSFGMRAPEGTAAGGAVVVIGLGAIVVGAAGAGIGADGVAGAGSGVGADSGVGAGAGAVSGVGKAATVTSGCAAAPETAAWVATGFAAMAAASGEAGTSAAAMSSVGAAVSMVGTLVDERSTTYSSTSSSCLPPIDFGAALTKRPPLAAAIATHPTPNVVVAETMYVIARRRSTRHPSVIIL